MMKVTYLAHSGFLVETESATLLFDYYEEEIPARDTGKPFYVFVSHAHADHFNPDIFALADARFLLSYDTEKKITQRNILHYVGATPQQIRYVRYDEEFTEGKLQIRTLKSNDRGVAYLVTVDGKTIYHAGDLNIWMKESYPKSINNNSKALFLREMEKIEGATIDVAFLPAEPGLGTYIFEGIKAFCKITTTWFIFPMHMWKEYAYIEALQEETLEHSPVIMRADEAGKVFELPL